MCRFTAIILFVFAGQPHALELATNHCDIVQNLVDRLVDKLTDKLFDQASLDDTTRGKIRNVTSQQMAQADSTSQQAANKARTVEAFPIIPEQRDVKRARQRTSQPILQAEKKAHAAEAKVRSASIQKERSEKKAMQQVKQQASQQIAAAQGAAQGAMHKEMEKVRRIEVAAERKAEVAAERKAEQHAERKISQTRNFDFGMIMAGWGLAVMLFCILVQALSGKMLVSTSHSMEYNLGLESSREELLKTRNGLGTLQNAMLNPRPSGPQFSEPAESSGLSLLSGPSWPSAPSRPSGLSGSEPGPRYADFAEFHADVQRWQDARRQQQERRDMGTPRASNDWRRVKQKLLSDLWKKFENGSLEVSLRAALPKKRLKREALAEANAEAKVRAKVQGQFDLGLKSGSLAAGINECEVRDKAQSQLLSAVSSGSLAAAVNAQSLDAMKVEADHRTAEDKLQCGDIVVLGSGLPANVRKRPAVVTEVHESHCTCIVLDDSWQHGSEECWPFFSDVSLISNAFRLGSRVVVCGMQRDCNRLWDGKVGTVILHPKEGHPCFLFKSGREPVLTICVLFRRVQFLFRGRAIPIFNEG